MTIKKCDYNDKLNFETTELKTKTNNKNKRKRNIVWYNPTFISSIKINMGKEFINIVKKYFNRNNSVYLTILFCLNRF